MQASNIKTSYLHAQWQRNIPIIAGTSMTNSPFARDGFNIAQHVSDEQQHVKKNREQLKTITMLHGNWLWLNQTHSNTVVDDEQYSYGVSADAIISRHADKIAVVMTADCLPILLSNSQGSEVAAIHAGWKGLLHEIISVTVKSLHSPPGDLHAWIGPCATQKNYEVDTAFYQRFCIENPANTQHFHANRSGHYLADLVNIARDQMHSLGIPNQHIRGGKYCSISERRFFSHRRDGKKSGRMASFIAPLAEL